ncbi:MAG TPA: hypothetical protein VFC44_17145 [Candidatus Saccharimonadales bacterium]|nr:hypothetical protein [Candidatus Saccharimonadales bacterium]
MERTLKTPVDPELQRRLFKAYAEKRKVTIFGTARTKLEEPEYQQAVEFGRKMAAAGYVLNTL